MNELPMRNMKRPSAAAAALETPPAGSVPSSFGFKLRRVQVAYNRFFFSQAGSHGAIPVNQIGALSLVFRNPGVTPTDLAALLNLDTAQVTPLLKQLVARGLIRREKSASDSRSHSLFVTDSGNREYLHLQATIAEVESVFVSEVLDGDEIQLLFDLLDRLEAAARLRQSASR